MVERTVFDDALSTEDGTESEEVSLATGAVNAPDIPSKLLYMLSDRAQQHMETHTQRMESTACNAAQGRQ